MSDQITIIGVRKKGRNYLAALDDDREVRIAATILGKYRIRKGDQFDQDQLDKIVLESEIIIGNDYINYLLGRRAYSVGHILNKLKEKGYSQESALKLVQRFREKGYLDDEQFAIEMTESILRSKPAGRGYIINKLRQKFISYELAQSTVDKIFQDIDVNNIALKLLRIRWRYFSKFDLESARTKAYNYLSRRSIGYTAAKYAFDKIVEEEKEEKEENGEGNE